MAYAAVEGMPEAKSGLRSNMLLALLANIHRAKDAEVRKPEDFELRSSLMAEVEAEDAVPPDAEDFDIHEASRALAARFGIKDF